MDYELKRLDGRDLTEALALAAHYRALNQPEQAESICLDVLDAEPDHQDGLRILGLALTDQFDGPAPLRLDEALMVFKKIRDGYQRVYYTGVAWERHAKAKLERGEGLGALHSFERALECFGQAEVLGPARTPDPILHWNRCVRALRSHPLLHEARRHPAHDDDSRFGD